MRAQHIISISGGKDSTAVACLAVERFQGRRGDAIPVRFVHADVGGNEHQITIDHIGYLDAWLHRELGARIEIVRADFTEQLAERRRNLAQEWGTRKELRRHSTACKELTSSMRPIDRRKHRLACDCARMVLEPVAQDLIEQALELLQPTGDPFLDLCMFKGRFPSTQARFCTEDLKLAPMQILKAEILAAGRPVIDWIGERAEESPARALKPALQRVRMIEGPSRVLYRPIHQWAAAQVFEIAARHGLKPNPLYLMGARRVGCWPCIMCGKDELINIANRTPEHIDRLREWERLVGMVSRRQAASFFSSSDVPGGKDDWSLGAIDEVVKWARTSRGGAQLDFLRSAEIFDADRDGAICDSAYGLCE